MDRILKLIISFETTTQAMAMEKFCRNKGLEGRLIPLPPAVSAGCGLAWCTVTGLQKELEQKMKEYQIAYQGMYEVLM